MKILSNQKIWLLLLTIATPFLLYASPRELKYRDSKMLVLRPFGGRSIEKPLFDYILTILPKGKTILEFGSSWATSQLSKHYTVYSVEHDKDWVNKYESNYIYAPKLKIAGMISKF